MTTGRAAINSGRPLFKFADAIDGARAITREEAREIARVDPSLIYVKECAHHDCEQRCVMVWTVFHASKAIKSFSSVEKARAFAAESGLAVQVGDCALPNTNPIYADSFWENGAQVYPHLSE
jgi:hypothetical protein